MANIALNSIALIIISIVVFILVVGVLIFVIIKDKKNEKKEIEELLQDYKREEQEDVNENTIEIEQVLEKMQKNIEAKPADVVATFEKEQEEKAIISYQELVKTLKRGTPKEEIKEEQIKEEIKIKEKPIKKEKFKSTDFISPVYGKMDEKQEYSKEELQNNLENTLDNFDEIYKNINLEGYLEEFSDINSYDNISLEQTLDLEPISSEIKKNEEFLKALKEFRENL